MIACLFCTLLAMYLSARRPESLIFKNKSKQQQNPATKPTNSASNCKKFPKLFFFFFKEVYFSNMYFKKNPELCHELINPILILPLAPCPVWEIKAKSCYFTQQFLYITLYLCRFMIC